MSNLIYDGDLNPLIQVGMKLERERVIAYLLLTELDELRYGRDDDYDLTDLAMDIQNGCHNQPMVPTDSGEVDPAEVEHVGETCSPGDDIAKLYQLKADNQAAIDCAVAELERVQQIGNKPTAWLRGELTRIVGILRNGPPK